MPTTLKVTLAGKVAPENKGGPRIGVGGKIKAKRTLDGSISVHLFRGDGEVLETYPTLVRSRWFGPFTGGTLQLLELSELDFIPDDDFTPRGYEMIVYADGDDLGGELGLLVTEPYAPAGFGP